MFIIYTLYITVVNPFFNVKQDLFDVLLFLYIFLKGVIGRLNRRKRNIGVLLHGQIFYHLLYKIISHVSLLTSLIEISSLLKYLTA